MSNITIYHNPACGTSRNTLEMIRNSGIEPTVILYLETPPSRDELLKLIADMGISVRALLRKNVEPYEELGLAEDKFTDDQLIDFMLQHPILINRQRLFSISFQMPRKRLSPRKTVKKSLMIQVKD